MTKSRQRARLLLPGLALILLGFAYPLTTDAGNAREPSPQSTHVLADRAMLARLTQGTMQKFHFHDAPKPLPLLQLRAPGGASHALSEWRGRLLLLNVWASWCEPCKDEMPALAQLERQLRNDTLSVITLSFDKEPQDAVRFLNHLGLSGLTLFVDPDRAVVRKLGVAGAPTSILIDSEGRELGRIEGAVDWQADEPLLLLKAIAMKTNAGTSGGMTSPQEGVAGHR